MANPVSAKPSAKTSRWGVMSALFILYFVWGSTYLALKIAIETIPPFPMLAVRFLAAGFLLYGFLRLRGVANPPRAAWFGSGLTGVILLVGGMGLVTFAEQWVASSLAAVLVATMPLWFALFSRFWGEASSSLEILGMALGLVGVIVINTEAGLRASPLGALLLFLAPICWAFGSALSRRLTQAEGLMASAVQMLCGGLALALLAALRGDTLVEMPSLRSSLALLYLISFGSILAFSAYVYLLNGGVRPALMSSYAYINPVVAVLLGVGLAGESIGVNGYWGMAIILLGVILVVSTRGKEAHREQQPKPVLARQGD